MATISYTVSASAGTATSKCTVTATYSVSNSNDRTTITVSKLVAGSTSTTGGANNSQKIAARDSLKQKMDNLVIALTFDGQTVATRTGATAGSTYTSYTGSKYVTKTHSAQTKTLKFVSTTASISVPAKPSYNVTFNANSGSGAPASQTKWYGETLTLSGTKPTKSGYTFKGWATSTANAGNGTVNYASGASYTGNAALTLYAVWELTYKKPAITEVTIEHCDANGDFDDEGSYAKVSFKWSVFKSTATRYYGGSTTPYSANAPTCSITVGSYTVTPTLTESPASVVVGGGTFTPEGEYNASITVSDTQTVYTGTSNTTTVTGKLTTAEYPMDVNPTGTAIGFFCSAPNSGRGIYIYGKSLLDTFYPVGSVYTTSTNTNPSTFLGGTWTLIHKKFKVSWITSGFTFNTTNTTDGAFVACLNGNTIEFRFYWKNKVAISDDTITIGTLTYSAVGISADHAVYPIGHADGLNAIAMCSFNLANSGTTATLQVWDWVTRATSYPTGTGNSVYLSFTVNIRSPFMLDSFCDEFTWKRTA